VSAADLLSEAMEDVAPLRVEKDHYGDWRLWDDENADVLMVQLEPEIARLLGLLLAAAPHLADVLDTHLMALTDKDVNRLFEQVSRLRDAITEAGEVL